MEFPKDQDVVHRASDPILADRRRRRSQGLAYAQTVGPAMKGAVTHPGARGERHVYADI